MSDAPKVFISYSWSSLEHEAWVLEFADRLQAAHVHVVLDKWDLLPGHELGQFMETMVTDPNVKHVLMICDEKYAIKADARTGGVGTEAQIISHQLYKKAKQDKFIAVVREHKSDGSPCVPTFAAGRLHIAMTNPITMDEEFERLIRLIHGAPMHPRPPLGPKPVFTHPSPAVSASRALSRAALAPRAGRSGKGPERGQLEALFDSLADEVSSSALTKEQASAYAESLAEVVSARSHLPQVLRDTIQSLERTDPEGTWHQALHHLFELSRQASHPGPEVSSWSDMWYEPPLFLCHEMFLVAIAELLAARDADRIKFMLSEPYIFRTKNGLQTFDYSTFDNYSKGFDEAYKRAENSSKISPATEFMKERAAQRGDEFTKIMEADLLVMVYTLFNKPEDYLSWFPRTLLYAGWHHGPFPLFFKAARRSREFEFLAQVLGVSSREEFLQKVISGYALSNLRNHRIDHVRFDYQAWLDLKGFGLAE